MREYILTERERKILETFIKQGIKLDGFSVLALRLERSNKKLIEDIELIKAALKKLANESTAKDRERRIRDLLNQLCVYAKDEHKVSLDESTAEDTLISYFRQHASDFQLLSSQESPLPSPTSKKPNLYIFARFAKELRDRNSQHYNTLLEVWLGHVLVDATLVPHPENLAGKLRHMNL